MTHQEMIGMVETMLKEYDLHTGSRAAEAVFLHPDQWMTPELFSNMPFYGAAARVLRELRATEAASAHSSTREEKIITALVNDYPNKFDDEYMKDPYLHIVHESGEMNVCVPLMFDKPSKTVFNQIVKLMSSDADSKRRRENVLKVYTFFCQQAARSYISAQKSEKQRDVKAARRHRNAAEKFVAYAEACTKAA